MMKNRIPTYLLLHILLMIYSLGSVFSKYASNESFLSFKFILFYGLMMLTMVIYAIGWQQIIKRLPLTNAYANKAVTLIWGLIWGVLLFGEQITVNKVLGLCLVLIGVIVFSTSDKDSDNE